MFAIIFMIYILLFIFYLFPAENYMYNVGGGDAGVQCGVFLELRVKTSARGQLKSVWCLYRWLWVYFALCSGVYIVGFEQVNTSSVSTVFADYYTYVCFFKEKYKYCKWKRLLSVCPVLPCQQCGSFVRLLGILFS